MRYQEIGMVNYLFKRIQVNVHSSPFMIDFRQVFSHNDCFYKARKRTLIFSSWHFELWIINAKLICLFHKTLQWLLSKPGKLNHRKETCKVLTKDQTYITEIKKLIRNLCTTNESLYNGQLKLELLKYEVRNLLLTIRNE